MDQAFERGWEAAAQHIGARPRGRIRPYRNLGPKGSWTERWTRGFNAAVRSYYAWRRLQRTRPNKRGWGA